MSSGHGVFSTRSEESKKRTTPDWVLIRRVYNYAKQYRKSLAIGVTTIVLGALTGLVSPYLHKIAIDQIILPKNLAGFVWWIPVFVFVTLMNYVLQYVQVFQMRIVGENVVAKMRDEMISKLQKISLRYFSEGETGRIMSRPTNDANNVRIFLRMGLTSIITDTSSILGSFFIIFALNAQLALIAVAILPAALGFAWLLGRFSRTAYRSSLTTLAGLTAKMQENLSGMKVIKSFVREKKSYDEFCDTQNKNVKAILHAAGSPASYHTV